MPASHLIMSAFIVWNVGQGQWVTWVTPKTCHHIDMGGEFFPKRVTTVCKDKMNSISLTHWDLDHVGFVLKFLRASKSTCVHSLPEGTHHLRTTLSPWPKCPELNILKSYRPKPVPTVPKQKSNAFSTVFILDENLLVTGDLPTHEERSRVKNLNLSSIRYLIAGHHGSSTSTSKELLARLKNLKLGLVSARRDRYGHPHAKVLANFSQKKTPVLKTEDWGHIIIELK